MQEESANPGAAGRTDKARKRHPQERASRTQRRIVESARLLLSGNAVLSNEAIAENASVSVSSIYRYFQNRGDLFAEMYRQEAADVFQRIASAIAGLDRHNGEQVMARVIEIAVRSVAGDRDARHESLRSIDYELAREISLQVNAQLHQKLVEQIALIANCHQRSVDTNLVAILARLLVGIPRAAVLEDAALIDETRFLGELARTAADLLERTLARADATRA